MCIYFSPSEDTVIYCLLNPLPGPSKDENNEYLLIKKYFFLGTTIFL